MKELHWWQIGSFGAITRILSIVKKREDLLKFAAAGPLAGFSLGVLLLLLGFILPPSDGLGVVVDAGVVHDSLLAGGIGKPVFHIDFSRPSRICFTQQSGPSWLPDPQLCICCFHVAFF